MRSGAVHSLVPLLAAAMFMAAPARLPGQDDQAVTLPTLELPRPAALQVQPESEPTKPSIASAAPPLRPPAQRRLFDDRGAAPRLGPVPEEDLQRKNYNLLASPTLGLTARDKLAVTGIGTVVLDSTRLSTPKNFVTRAIPVEGQPFFEPGWRSAVFGDASIVSYDIQANTSVGPFRAYYANDFADQRTGDFGYRLRHAYGQLGGLVAGQTFSVFTDPDHTGNRASTPDPPNALYLLQPSISYRSESAEVDGRWLTAAIGLGDPKPQVHNASGIGSESYSRFPDLMVSLRKSNQHRGYLQLSGVVRSLAMQTANNALNDHTIGWGIHLSGGLLPDSELATRKDLRCRFGFSLAYGEGYGQYHTDLTGSPNDAVFDAFGRMHALPLVTCRTSYTHNWTDRLRSTVIGSFTHLDSLPAQGPLAYRQTHHAQANTQFNLYDNVIVGLEYYYGHKITLNGADGDAHRIAFVVGVTNK